MRLAASPAFFTRILARIGSDLGGRTGHQVPPEHPFVFIALHATQSTQPSFLGRRFLHRIATLLLELIVTSSTAHPLRRVSPRSQHEQQPHSGFAWGYQGPRLHRELRHLRQR